MIRSERRKKKIEKNIYLFILMVVVDIVLEKKKTEYNFVFTCFILLKCNYLSILTGKRIYIYMYKGSFFTIKQSFILSALLHIYIYLHLFLCLYFVSSSCKSHRKGCTEGRKEGKNFTMQRNGYHQT